jgi:hypothetical protein
VNESADKIELMVLIGVIVLAVVGLGVALDVIVNSRRDRTAAMNAIANYLKEHGGEVLSFEDIRGSIDEGYSDEFLHSLTKSFPDSLRFDYLPDERTGKPVKSALWLVVQNAASQPAQVYGRRFD